MRKMEVCFDARMLWHGGIGTYIRNLLLGLKSSSFSIKVITAPDILKKEKWLEDYDLILSTASIYSVREQMDFFLRVPKVDLFFSPHYNIPLVPIKAAKRVVTIHDVFHLAYISSLRWHERLYARYVIHQAIHRSNAVITDSQFSSDEIYKYTGGEKKKIQVIHCAVDRTLFQREKNENQIQKTVEKFSLPSCYFLFVGNLKPHKNLRGLLLAMRQVDSDIKLVIVGKSDGMKHVDTGALMYEKYPELKNRILWLSSVASEELPILYQLAKALVFPSYYEGFGLPPLEAMSCGCPVIASNAASLPEVCGQAALYVSPEDWGQIALAMKKIKDNVELKKELIRKGYQNEQRFSWERSVQKHVELFERVLGSK